MKIKIKKAEKLSIDILEKIGFSTVDAKLITKNLIDAELAGRKSHGLIRLLAIKKRADEKRIAVTEKEEFSKVDKNYLLLEAKRKPGFIGIYKSLEKAIPMAKKSNVVIAGVKDAGYCTGFMGAYAREAVLKDLIFISFTNSSGGMVPYGAKQELWGTNPVTFAIPAKGKPVILDMASSKITWGTWLVAKNEGKKLPKGVAIDKEGVLTTDPEKAVEGGFLPIAMHKGSGLGFIVDLLAGALTGSMVGKIVKGGWGTFYILIKPIVFRPIDEFKKDVSLAIKELKGLPKAKGFREIYFPGEQSLKKREETLKKGEIEVGNELMIGLEKLTK